jgi:hypothetical protein
MTFAFATPILVPALLVAAAALASFAYCAASYQRALSSERNAWWMRGPCGRIFLALGAPNCCVFRCPPCLESLKFAPRPAFDMYHPVLAVFWLSSLPRFRVLLDARMAAEAQQKCKALAAEHSRASDGAKAPSSSADSSHHSTAIEVGRSANIWFFGSSTFTYWTRLAHDVHAACSEIESRYGRRDLARFAGHIAMVF